MQAASAILSTAERRVSPQRFTRPLFAALIVGAIAHALVSPALQQSLAAFAAAH